MQDREDNTLPEINSCDVLRPIHIPLPCIYHI